MTIRSRLIIAAAISFFLSCKSSSSDHKKSTLPSISEENFLTTRVRIYEVTQTDFQQQLLTNGKLEAGKTLTIKFPMNERVTSVYVKSGQRVQKNELLAELDNTSLQRKLTRKKEVMEKAITDLDDKLIDYGYRLSDSGSIPSEIFKMAKIKSNYESARMDLEDLIYEIGQSNILAPEDGIIADMEAKPGSYPDNNNYKCCVLVTNKEMFVTFMLLESDLPNIREGMTMTINSYSNKDREVKGSIHSINPMIDKDGMIKVKGVIPDPGNSLLAGMNVKVKIIHTIPKQTVVPKETIVLKSGRKVVFMAEAGQAKWNEVKTGAENEQLIVITSGLYPGQKVIISNPELLSNGAGVTIDSSHSFQQ